MEQIVALIGVEVDFLTLRIVVVLDKRIVIGGTVWQSERLRHEVPGEETMPDGLGRLTQYLTLNSWPDISAIDRATLLNVTNAARNASDESALEEL